MPIVTERQIFTHRIQLNHTYCDSNKWGESPSIPEGEWENVPDLDGPYTTEKSRVSRNTYPPVSTNTKSA